MVRKKVTKIVKYNEVFELPSDNTELAKFIQRHKTDLTEQALTSIEYAVSNKLPYVEVFKFNNSDFVITISENDYLLNVDHIYKFYLESENYELCSRVVKLQSLLKNSNSNEKEIEINGEAK